MILLEQVNPAPTLSQILLALLISILVFLIAFGLSSFLLWLYEDELKIFEEKPKEEAAE